MKADVTIVATRLGGDSIKISVLDDGTLKVETDAISMANHGNAEALLAALAADFGGEVKVVRKAAHHHYHCRKEQKQ